MHQTGNISVALLQRFHEGQCEDGRWYVASLLQNVKMFQCGPPGTYLELSQIPIMFFFVLKGKLNEKVNYAIN